MKKVSIYAIIATMMLALVFTNSAFAKSKAYPSKPIKVISPYSPGGDSDLTARVWADFAKKELLSEVEVKSRFQTKI